MDRRRIRRSTVRAVAAVTAALLAVPLAGVPARGQSTDCPAVIPTAEVSKGMTGRGVTVAEGRTREGFQFEVLGVLKDAIGPGRDLIIVDTSGDVVERYGGIFFGMSGSPLYTQDNKLVGAIAYGLSYGPSTVAGVTPASDMMKVLSYPPGDGESDRRAYPRRAKLSWHQRSKIAASRKMAPSEVGSSLTQLPVPFGVSGLSARGVRSVSKVIDEEKLPFIPYAAGAAQTEPAAGPPPQAGDNVSAVLSVGDVSFAGTGTVTAVCDGKMVAFGHPYFWEGDANVFSSHAADTVTVVEDPFGSYELANVAEPVGLIDQDRLAGIRGTFGESPVTIPVTSSVSSLETQQSREGETRVVDSELLPFIAFYHLGSNILVTMDEYGSGSSTVTYRIEGVTSEGTPWSLERDNMYSSKWGIADASAYELESVLYALVENDFEDIEFTSVDATANVEKEVRRLKVSNVLVSLDGENYEDRFKVRVFRGDTLYLRALLKPTDDSENLIPVDLSVTIPRNARDGYVELVGRRFYEENVCFTEGERCEANAGDPESFEELLANLASQPRNNEVFAQLRTGRGSRVQARSSEVVDRIVFGRRRVKIDVATVPNVCCSGGSNGSGGSGEPEPIKRNDGRSPR